MPIPSNSQNRTMDLKVYVIGMHSQDVDHLVELAFQSGFKDHATQNICIEIQYLTICI